MAVCTLRGVLPESERAELVARVRGLLDAGTARHSFSAVDYTEKVYF